VAAGIFHHFHHEWISEISRTINRRLAGTDYYALAEQVAGGLGPDVLTLQRPLGKSHAHSAKRATNPNGHQSVGTLTLTDNPPQVRFRITEPPKWYAAKKMSVTIRHVSEDRVVAVIEIISPGNKDSRNGLMKFVQKTDELLAAGIHLSLVDLFPPTPRDPEGIHPMVWGEGKGEGDEFRFDPARPLTCASYIAGPVPQAFVDPAAIGEKLPDLSVFLTSVEYISVPLEATYQAAFDAVPEVWRDVLEEK
jgi:hypothetical protein